MNKEKGISEENGLSPSARLIRDNGAANIERLKEESRVVRAQVIRSMIQTSFSTLRALFANTLLLRLAHRVSAGAILMFLAFHMVNHLWMLRGVEAHQQVMEVFRTVYTASLVEALLVGCVAFQVISGVRLLYQRWGYHRDLWDRLQSASGAYLAYFLIAHVVAVLVGRHAWGVETNIYFAAAGLHAGGAVYYFTPYYFLGVVAVFAHLACALRALVHRSSAGFRPEGVATGVIVLGIAVAAVLVAAMSGAFYTIEIPQTYLEPYR